MWQAGAIPPTLGGCTSWPTGSSTSTSSTTTTDSDIDIEGNNSASTQGPHGLFVGYYAGSSPYAKQCLTEDGKLKAGFFEQALSLEAIQVRATNSLYSGQ